MMRIYPAIMGVEEIGMKNMRLLKGVSDYVHIDVMDNFFVPNFTKGTQLINEYVKQEDLFAWIHLMVKDPIDFYTKYELPEGALVSFHIEACEDIFEMIKTIKEKKQLVGIAIRPKTPVQELIPFLNVIDQALLMSVEPGFSGQSFLGEVIDKIENLVRYRQASNLEFRIGVDGGINRTNIALLAQKGVDDCAVATGIFGNTDPAKALQELYHIIECPKTGLL